MASDSPINGIDSSRAPLPDKGGAGGGFGTSDRDRLIRDAIIRTVAFFDVIDYAPLWTECAQWIEWHGSSGFESQALPRIDELIRVRDELESMGIVKTGEGRIALAKRYDALIAIVHERLAYMPRKLRRARRIAKWLARFRAVRFVSLVNTTPLGHARNGGDLDLFVIVRSGHIWTIRLLAGLPYRLLGKLASDKAAPDAVCLSYFITDDSLDLQSHTLKPDDPYFRYWFLSMLPLFDDGISSELWHQNECIRVLHPRAEQWLLSPDLAITPRSPSASEGEGPPFFSSLENVARRLQYSWFPKRIRERMNRDSSVIVTDHALKFHVDDRREEYRQKYKETIARIIST
ncbi:MAG: hypothetical protein WC477_04305 [Patescibacteria group bacterium]